MHVISTFATYGCPIPLSRRGGKDRASEGQKIKVTPQQVGTPLAFLTSRTPWAMSTKGLLQVMSFSFSYVAIGVRLFGPPGQCGPRFARCLQFSFRKFFLILSAPPDQPLLLRPLGRRRELFRLRRFSALRPNFFNAQNPLGFSHFFGVVHGGACTTCPPFCRGLSAPP